MSCARLAIALLLVVSIARAEEPTAEVVAPSKPPKLVHFVEADTPPTLAARGRVDVTLTLDVDEQGHVREVAVATPGPPGEGFDEAAIAAARAFVFTPAESDGKPVPVRVTYRYRFAMKPPPAPAHPVAVVTTVPVHGRVLKKGDRTPVSGVAVILDEQQVVTDEKGEFHFDAVTPGEHTLALRGPDIAKVDTKISPSAGKRLELTYYVDQHAAFVSTTRGTRVVVEAVEETLAGDEIKHVPGTTGDLLKAVQTLPGVARAPFGLGLLIVWGSAPQDTRVYVDGVYIPTLYHFGGLRSTVNSDMVQSLDFVPGAYSVDRGLGLGGIVNIESRRPRTDGYHGFAQLDLYDGSLMVEGPITKKLSFAVAGRASIIGLFLPIFQRGNDAQLTTQYYDYQARLTYRPTKRDDLDLFFFGSDDKISLTRKNSDADLSAEFGSHTYFHRGIASWHHRFAKEGTLAVTTSIGYDVPFQSRVARGDSVSSVDPGLLSYTLRAVARIPVTSFLRLDGGLDYEGNRFTFDRALDGGSAQGGSGRALGGVGAGANTAPDDQLLYTNQIAPYASATLSLWKGRVLVVPQFRLQVMSFAGYPGTSSSYTSAWAKPEPRLAVRVQALPWLAVKGAIGVYDQPPLPQDFSVVYGNQHLAPEWGTHYVLGFDLQPTRTLHIELEGFYKDLRNLVVPGELSTDPLFVNDGRGRVYGGEVLVRQELWHNFFGWISYTLSRSERKDYTDQSWHLFQYDQTHILSLVASYKLPRGYQIGVRFRYVTGNPYTAVTTAYFNGNTGSYTPVAGPMYGSRLPAFQQLDIRFDKTWTFNRWRLSFYLDLQNLYDAKNPEGISYNYNYTKKTTIDGLPILPVVGLRAEF